MLGVEQIDIFYGDSEYKFIDYDNKKYYMLDFYIKSLNIAIEYNGCAFHPKRIDDLLWKHPFGKDIKTVYEYDRLKATRIIDSGITLFEVWSNDNLDEIKKEIQTVILNRIEI